MRSIVLVVLAACASAAGAPATGTKTPPPPAWLVVWHTGNGWTTLAIDAHRVAHYDFHPFGHGANPADARRFEEPLAPDVLAQLETKLAACKVCDLPASHRDPVPEEGSQDVTLALGKLHCTTSLLANDWYKPPAATCAAALDALTEHVRTHGRAVPRGTSSLP